MNWVLTHGVTLIVSEWPPRSGKTAHFPEVDRAAWFDPGTAKQKINPAQSALIDELLTRI